MQENPIPADARRKSEETAEATIMALLLSDDSRWPWAADELVRELGASIATTDAINRLHAAGLVHRCGEFFSGWRHIYVRVYIEETNDHASKTIQGYGVPPQQRASSAGSPQQ